MYLSRNELKNKSKDEQEQQLGSRSKWRNVSGNVFCLGLTSLFTDISSEMVGAILPIYLMFELRFSPFHLGILDGFYQAAAVLVRLIGGMIADSRGRHKEVALLGYGTSMLSRLGLVFSGAAWLPITVCLFIDRVGKGIRTAPRDALIGLSSAKSDRGRAFGVHRTMDATGALLGPVIAFAILAAAPRAYDAIFVVSLMAAIIGVSILAALVRNPKTVAPDQLGPTFALARITDVCKVGEYQKLLIAGSILALATVSDTFIYLLIQRKLELNPTWFPLLYVGTASVFLLGAVPMGAIADRLGRRRVFLFGYLLLMGVYLLLQAPVNLPEPLSDPVIMGLSLALLGLFYACTDGVLMAQASVTVPAGQLTVALALLTTIITLTKLISSVVFGYIWDTLGAEVSLAGFSVFLLAAFVAACFLIHQPRSEVRDSIPGESSKE